MKIQKWYSVIICFLVAMLLLPFSAKPAKADGGIFYPKDYYSAETTQKAFIYYADQTENLVVFATFRGNAKDFAWVIPTPDKPTVEKSETGLFDNLAEITKTASSGPGIVYDTPTLGIGGGAKSTPVEVISEKTIDVYDTAVLKASDENSLAEWLTNNGYSFPSEQSSNLKSYVDDGWYFTVAKIRPDLIQSGGIVPELAEGTLTPLRLTFRSDKIIYPMRLTGIALTQEVPSSVDNSISQESYYTSRIPITLYILADHKTEQSLLSTTWANWIHKTEISKLNNSLGDIISGDKLFLTKMSDSVNIKDISDDFIITATSDNNVYPTPVYKSAGFWLGNLLFLFLVPIIIFFFPIPLGLVFFVFLVLQKYVKKKWLYILGSIYQILACLTLTCVGLAILAMDGFDFFALLLENGFIGGMISLVAMLVLAIYLTIKMIKRYKTIYRS